MSALLLDEALKMGTPLDNGAISKTLQQFAASSVRKFLANK